MKKNWILIITPFLHFLASWFFPFTYWPEMLNWPLILSHGWLPYKDFTIIHTPLLPCFLTAFYATAGNNPFSLHLIASLFSAITNLLLCVLLLKSTHKRLTTLFGGLMYIYLTFAFEGNTLWFESILAPIFLACFILMQEILKRNNRKLYLILGVLYGIAFLAKQTSAYLLPVFGIFFAYQTIKKRLTFQHLIAFAPPLVVAFVSFAAFLIYFGLLTDFYHWAVEFVYLLPNLSVSNVPPDLLLPSKKQFFLIIAMVLTGIYALFQTKKFETLLALTFLVFSILFIFPRFSYFHLLISIPFLIYLLSTLVNTAPTKITISVIGGIALLTFPVLRGTFMTGNRFYNQEAIEVSRWLRENYPTSTIFSLNGPDLVYSLTGKVPAVRPWVDQLPWEMIFFGDQNFLQAFKKGNPELVIFRPYLDKPVDGLGAYQPKLVVEYVFTHYREIKRFPSGVLVLKKI